VNVTVRLFAGLRRAAGRREVVVALDDGARVVDLLDAVRAQLPGFEPGQCVVAVNREYAPPTLALHDGDEIALVPPVSGGAGPVRGIRVTQDPLDVGAIHAGLTHDGAGAIVVFQGVTREVASLEYEVYAEMAEVRMRSIAEEEAERHGLLAVIVEHRAGSVMLREASVVIGVAAAHRGEAFAGARAVLDRIKAEAPIWKQEITDTGPRSVPGTMPPVPPDASCVSSA
jgi:molybdopterin converting factor subunit 1